MLEDKRPASEGLWLPVLQGSQYLRFASPVLLCNLYSTFPSEAGAGSLGRTDTRPFLGIHFMFDFEDGVRVRDRGVS
jgi:hypothetical protein